MFDIKEKYNKIKAHIKEKRDAKWLEFKSKLPENLQNNIDKFSNWYSQYKQTSLCEIIETIVFVLVMVIIIRFFIAEIRWIPSGSMNPTLIEGDRIVVERFSRFHNAPKRGDIMVFYPPSTNLSKSPLQLFARLTGILCKDVAYIKRVVGLPGDTIEIKQEKSGETYVYINGEKYEESYIKSVYDYPPCKQTNLDIILSGQEIMKCGPFEIPENHYFMMGDNRGASYDSRYWGTVEKDRFVGRAVTIFWPLNRLRILHRLEK